MKYNVQKIVSEMTLEEKASLCSGEDFWHTKVIKRLGIPAVMMADGPHGLRKAIQNPDEANARGSLPATCFPTASALACSWNPDLIQKVGAALGEECLAEQISILLGPGCNIKRSPLCGRNFEYFSEDPYLVSEIASAYIQGVQSKGVGAAIKHFAANNQETLRFIIDAVIDERTLREVYLAGFEGAIKKTKPWLVMCAYNSLNGDYCSENKRLLNDILKKEWGYKGFVVSDWGAVYDRVKGLAAGLDLEMPGSNGERDRKIAEAVLSGKLKESVLNKTVKRMLKVIFKASANLRPEASYDKEAHHKLAKAAALESIVLLKNEDEILPLKKTGTLAVIGAFAKKPRFQGGGSSHVNPAALDIPYDEIAKAAEASGLKLLYADGYAVDETDDEFGIRQSPPLSDTPDEALIKQAADAASKADTAVIFAGLDNSEFEGADRKHLRIPDGQRALIEAVAVVQENTAVVLSNGAPVEMPWLDSVKGVIEGHLCGQAFGGAIAEILFGIANPSGKLAETFPVRLADNPSFLNFPGGRKKVEYHEGLFVGYRYYDAKDIGPLFPFGYGLSYTSFEYSDLRLDKKTIDEGEPLRVTVSVKNTGKRPGKETVQLYVRDVKSSVVRPVKELKGFVKLDLRPGEQKQAAFILDRRAFAYYDDDCRDWAVESGEFEILAGRSSTDIALKDTVYVSASERRVLFTPNSSLQDILEGCRRTRVVNRLAGEFLKGFPDGTRIGDLSSQVLEMPLRSAFQHTKYRYSDRMMDLVLSVLNKD
jgi:beta-glucosidase